MLQIELQNAYLKDNDPAGIVIEDVPGGNASGRSTANVRKDAQK